MKKAFLSLALVLGLSGVASAQHHHGHHSGFGVNHFGGVPHHAPHHHGFGGPAFMGGFGFGYGFGSPYVGWPVVTPFGATMLNGYGTPVVPLVGVPPVFSPNITVVVPESRPVIRTRTKVKTRSRSR